MQKLFSELAQPVPVFWVNPHLRPMDAVIDRLPVGLAEMDDAARRLDQFAGLLALLFPELLTAGGEIESELLEVSALREALSGSNASGTWYVKADHALPVAGSIKARGGIYEVLLHADRVAQAAGLIDANSDRSSLASADARHMFSQHTISVGSTGNLGLSIGVMAAALGFRAEVHMSSEAKQWKKDRLRARGVTVVEHAGDYGLAVAAGREAAQRDDKMYFVDDEDSKHLFLGYSVAALRLKNQLLDRGIFVDAEHPLFVYLPCGVGGAPGGIAFGLRLLFGDDVHCFFVEPVGAPCMLARLANPLDAPISIKELGLSGVTDADGLAVARASEFVAQTIKQLISGIYTVSDDCLYRDLYMLEKLEGIRVEPSAAAGVSGPKRLLNSPAGRQFLIDAGLANHIDAANHIIWTTGGAFVPESEYKLFWERGRLLSKNL